MEEWVKCEKRCDTEEEDFVQQIDDIGKTSRQTRQSDTSDRGRVVV